MKRIATIRRLPTSPKRKLCVLCHCVALVQNDQLELGPAHGRPQALICHLPNTLRLLAVEITVCCCCCRSSIYMTPRLTTIAHPNRVRELAKSCTCCRTTPMPRSSEAFSSSTMLRKEERKIERNITIVPWQSFVAHAGAPACMQGRHTTIHKQGTEIEHASKTYHNHMPVEGGAVDLARHRQDGGRLAGAWRPVKQQVRQLVLAHQPLDCARSAHEQPFMPSQHARKRWPTTHSNSLVTLRG